MREYIVRGVVFSARETNELTQQDREVFSQIPCPACNEIPKHCNLCDEESPWCDGHDPCIGHIDEDIKGVCCGHGGLSQPYISFQDKRYKNEEALEIIARLAPISPLASNQSLTA